VLAQHHEASSFWSRARLEILNRSRMSACLELFALQGFTWLGRREDIAISLSNSTFVSNTVLKAGPWYVLGNSY
jgi:hypothetical protein